MSVKSYLDGFDSSTEGEIVEFESVLSQREFLYGPFDSHIEKIIETGLNPAALSERAIMELLHAWGTADIARIEITAYPQDMRQYRDDFAAPYHKSVSIRKVNKQ